MNNTHKAKVFLNHLFLQGLWIFPLKINLLIGCKSNLNRSCFSKLMTEFQKLIYKILFFMVSLYMATLWRCLVPFDSLFQSVYSYSLSMILFLSVVINTFIFVFCLKSLLMRTQIDPHPCFIFCFSNLSLNNIVGNWLKMIYLIIFIMQLWWWW